jgi:hypothetical protein
VWAVTFDSSGPDVEGDSIADGVYKITAHGSAITWATGPDAGTPVAADQMQVDTFYRLFGDFTGIGRVTGGDLTSIQIAVAQAPHGSGGELPPSSPFYNAAFDPTGEGANIDGDDVNLVNDSIDAGDSGFAPSI